MLATAAMGALIAAPNGFNPGGASDEDILADFRLLDRKMSEWETYAEIIAIIRSSVTPLEA